jgi:hypothetical protein
VPSFGLGWAAARIDIQHLVKESRALPRSYFQGLNFLLNEQPDRAIESFVDAVKVDPQTIELHFALGSLFRRRGETERAIRMHQNLVEREDLPQDLKLQALAELGQDYLKAGLLDRAEEVFDKLQDSAMVKEAKRNLLEIYQLEKDWEKAIAIAAELPDIASQKEIAEYYCELAAADGQAQMPRLGVGEAAAVAPEVVEFAAEGLGAELAFAEASHLRDQPFTLAGAQELAGLGAPGGAAGARPVGAGLGEDAEMLDHVVEVDELHHQPGTGEDPSLDQGGKARPDPRGAVGDQQHPRRRHGGQQRPVGAQQREECVGAAQGAVDQRRKGPVQATLLVDDIQMQQQGFAPVGVITRRALGRAPALLVAPNPQPPAIDRHHQGSPRLAQRQIGGLAAERLPGALREVAGHAPQRLDIHGQVAGRAQQGCRLAQ